MAGYAGLDWPRKALKRAINGLPGALRHGIPSGVRKRGDLFLSALLLWPAVSASAEALPSVPILLAYRLGLNPNHDWITYGTA